MATKELGQFYFKINDSSGCLEVSPNLAPSQLEWLPDVCARVINLFESINAENYYLLSRIMGYWLHSKFPPPYSLKLIYNDLISSETTDLRAREDDAKYGMIGNLRINQDIVRQIMKGENITQREAAESIDNSFDLLNGIVGDLEDAPELEAGWEEENDGLMYSSVIMCSLSEFPQRFIKQLALSGILTTTQLQELSQEQIEEVKKTRVPRKFHLPQSFHELLDLLDELKPLSRDSNRAYTTLPFTF